MTITASRQTSVHIEQVRGNMISLHVTAIGIATIAVILTVGAAVAVSTGHEHLGLTAIIAAAVTASTAGMAAVTDSARQYRQTIRNRR